MAAINILTEKRELRPINYPVFENAYIRVVHSRWSHYEVEDISPDVKNWTEDLCMTSKKVIGNIFKAFTLQEGVVNDYWRGVVANKFRHPEIIHMATAFSDQESNHEVAYDFLESSLPLSECVTSEFKSDPIAMKKLGDMIDFQSQNEDTDLALSLAIFSGFIEGVSLYASFAILLSFTMKGYLKTMSQILSWSVRDEQLHSEMGIELYKTLVKERGYEPDHSKIYEAAQIIVSNEEAFIRSAFDGTEELDTVTLEEALSFVRYRANKKLMELGLKPIIENDQKYKKLADFFYTTVEGKAMNDFFAMSRNGGGYSAVIPQNFMECNYEI